MWTSAEVARMTRPTFSPSENSEKERSNLVSQSLTERHDAGEGRISPLTTQWLLALHSQVSAWGTSCCVPALALHSQLSALGVKLGDSTPKAMAIPAANLIRVNMIFANCVIGSAFHIPYAKSKTLPVSLAVTDVVPCRYGVFPLARRLLWLAAAFGVAVTTKNFWTTAGAVVARAS